MYNYFLLLACLLVFLSCDSQSRQEKSTSDISAERLRAIIKDRPPLPYAPEAYTLTEPLNDLVARRQALLDTLAQLKSDTVPIMTDTSFARYERDILVQELKTKVAIYRDRIAMEMLSICGPTADFQHVESYHPTQGIPATLVNRCCNSIGLLQWKQDFRHVTGITDKGNVSGLGWGSGSLIADDLFLTAGHCFAPDNSGHRFPTRNGICLKYKSI